MKARCSADVTVSCLSRACFVPVSCLSRACLVPVSCLSRAVASCLTRASCLSPDGQSNNNNYNNNNKDTSNNNNNNYINTTWLSFFCSRVAPGRNV